MGSRVLLVDDSAVFVEAARSVLAADGYDVVGVAGDGREALDLAVRLAPDLVVLDIGLPDLDGFEVARRLSRLDRPPAVVLTSSHDWTDRPARVAASGARGFVPKDRLAGAALHAVLGATG